ALGCRHPSKVTSWLRAPFRSEPRARRDQRSNDFQVLWALVSRPCNDQGEGVGRGREEGSAIVGNMFNAPAFARKNAVEQFIDLSAGINYKRGSLGTRRKNEDAARHAVNA